MPPITYLACPYSHPDPQIQEARAELATAYAAHLFRRGRAVYSPLTHSHLIMRHGAAGDWEAWRKHDLAFLAVAAELVVLALPGWHGSVGVRAEIEAARGLSLPVLIQRLNDREALWLRHFAGFPDVTFSEPEKYEG